MLATPQDNLREARLLRISTWFKFICIAKIIDIVSEDLKLVEYTPSVFIEWNHDHPIILLLAIKLAINVAICTLHFCQKVNLCVGLNVTY